MCDLAHQVQMTFSLMSRLWDTNESFLFFPDLWSPPREEEEVAFAWLYQSWCLVCFGAVLSELMILKWLQVKKKKKEA